MRVWVALAICAGLAGLVAVLPETLLLGAVPHLGVLYRAAALVLGVLLAADANRLRVREYATSFGYNPAWLCLLVVLWPLVVVPWYLTVREGIRSGRTPRRPGAGATAGRATGV